jgi:hypothetical protein
VRHKGQITNWNDDRGFGFITPAVGGEQVFGILGGWPGALVAQTTLRHKSRKTSFRIVFWATVAMNCAGLFWAYSNMERFAVWG